MKIGLIIAIDRELAAFLHSGEERTEETVAGKTVYHTCMEGHDIYAVRSGCGEIDAAAATMLLIALYECKIILNFGVAGALEADLHVDDLFVVEKTCHYDFDTSAVDPVKKGQYTEYRDEFIPLDAELVRLVTEQMPEIRKIAAASADRFVEDREEKIRLREMGCGICDMETAGIARTCERSGARCLSIKCISDTFEGDGGDFSANVCRSAEKAFLAIRTVMKLLEPKTENSIWDTIPVSRFRPYLSERSKRAASFRKEIRAILNQAADEGWDGNETLDELDAEEMENAQLGKVAGGTGLYDVDDRTDIKGPFCRECRQAVVCIQPNLYKCRNSHCREFNKPKGKNEIDWQ